MSITFSSAKNTIAECDRCGFQYKLKELKKLEESGRSVNLMVCSTCWEPEHPQDDLGKYPVFDPQAVRNPRPDTSYYTESGSRKIQWGWNPVGGGNSYYNPETPNDLVATGSVGAVNVVIS